MNFLRMAARVAITFTQGNAKDEVSKAFNSDPELQKWLLQLSGPSITWIAKQLREGEDPFEVAQAVKDIWNADYFYPRIPTSYKDLKDIKTTLLEIDRKKNIKYMDEDMVEAMLPFKAAFKKAYEWEPKLQSDGWSAGWDSTLVLDAVVDGRKPVGEVRGGIKGERPKSVEGTPAFHTLMKKLGLKTTPVDGSINRRFIFRPENEDIARMVKSFYLTNSTGLSDSAVEFVIGVGFGYPLESTLKWAGYDETPSWVETLLA